MAIEDGYSICLNEWALDKEIKNELNILVIISSLTAKKGYCYASNKWFAELFGIDEVSVSRKIKKLEQAGYITIDYKKRGFEVTNREIRLTRMLSTINENVNRPLTEMLSDDSQDCYPTINKNVNYNNTIINNTNNNITNPNTGEFSNQNKNTNLEKNYQKETKEPRVPLAPRGVIAPKISKGERVPVKLRGLVAEWQAHEEAKKAIEDYILFLKDTYNTPDIAIKQKITQIKRMASNVPQGVEIICRYNIDRNYATPYKPSDYKKQMADAPVISEQFTGEFVTDANGEIEEV